MSTFLPIIVFVGFRFGYGKEMAIIALRLRSALGLENGELAWAFLGSSKPGISKFSSTLDRFFST